MIFPFIPIFVMNIASDVQTLSLPVDTVVAQMKDHFWPSLQRWRCHQGNVDGCERADFEDSDWPSVELPFRWEQGTYYFRSKLVIPEKIAGVDVANAPCVLAIMANLKEEVYINGELAGKIPFGIGSVPLAARPRPGETFVVVLKVEAGSRTKGRLEEVRLESEAVAEVARPVRQLMDQLFTAQELSVVEPRLGGAAVLAETVAKFDLEALRRGDTAKVLASVNDAAHTLQALSPRMKEYTVYLPGQSHIDLAWLWRWPETVEVCRETFSNMLKLMDEYPEFHYSQSMAQAYVWMEEYHPEIFREIQRRVKEGRWEIVGGMWVEPDCNMPSGESFVRQLLYGKRYFQEKFGVDVKVGWNVDSFGYNWNLPQIYKKAGVTSFVTMKLHANDVTEFPHHTFWWQAPDGSRVLVTWPVRNFYGGHREDFVKMVRAIAAFSKETGLKHLLFPYGIGDHGGGPTPEELQGIRRLRDDPIFPRLVPGTVEKYFDSITDAPLPVWNNELYLQFHRGTYTSHADAKANNRRAEHLMTQAETFASLASQNGFVYPHAELAQAWKKVLFNQQHDILPGTSIPEVYEDAAKDYAAIFQIGERVRKEALEHLVAQIDTRGAGVPVVVFNPLARRRTDVAKFTLASSFESFAVFDDQGREVLSQLRRAENGSRQLMFIAAEVPSLGYRVYWIRPGKTAQAPMLSLKVTEQSLENEYYRIVIDSKTGCMVSLFDKRHGREVLGSSSLGNLLQAFADGGNAWDFLGPHDQVENWNLTDVESISVLERGPMRSVVRVTRAWRSSHFVQDIVLYDGLERIDFPTRIDWHERHTCLKVAFPVSVVSDSAHYEIPFAAIARSTRNQTPEERAQYEVPALAWADLSDDGYGVSLLNDSKYGYDIKGSLMRLTLLRSPTSPDPNADQGKHAFTYSLYPHARDWREASTVQRGYEVNCPLLVVQASPHQGQWPSRQAFLEVEPPHVIAAVVKKAEASETWIVRLYESTGRKVAATLKFCWPMQEVVETDLLERKLEPIKVKSGKISFGLAPYEIKSLCVRF